MSNIIDQANNLRQQAISLLVAERQTIDDTLASMGADGSGVHINRCKVCSKCGDPSHNARTCKKEAPDSAGANTTSST